MTPNVMGCSTTTRAHVGTDNYALRTISSSVTRDVGMVFDRILTLVTLLDVTLSSRSRLTKGNKTNVEVAIMVIFSTVYRTKDNVKHDFVYDGIVDAIIH